MSSFLQSRNVRFVFSCLLAVTALGDWYLLPRMCGFRLVGSLFHSLINPVIERLLIFCGFGLFSAFKYLVGKRVFIPLANRLSQPGPGSVVTRTRSRRYPWQFLSAHNEDNDKALVH